MTQRSGYALLVAICSAVLACDAGVQPVDGRTSAPERMAWATQLRVPGRLALDKGRASNGPVERFMLSGPPGAYTFTATMSGSSCASDDKQNQPVIELRIDGSTGATWQLAREPTAYSSARFAIADGPRRFDLVFTNDYSNETCDRNVVLHSIEVTSAR